MYDVTALGELLIDFACLDTDGQGYPALKANPGGAPGNFLAALQKYGCKTAMIGKVGDDAFGRLLLNTLNKLGIDARGVIADARAFTTLAFVTLDKSGNREFSFARKPGADTRLTASEIDYALIDNCAAFHFGTLSLTDEPSRSATMRAAEYAREKGKLVSVDPNLRKPLWQSERAAREAMEWSLNMADVVKLSEDEAEFLWGLSAMDAADKLLSECGVSLAYITLGADGCLAANRNGRARVNAPKGIKAVDTTGAGDIFGGAAMSGLIKLGARPRDLTEAQLYDIAGFACCAASLSTQVYGGLSSAPDERDVRELMAKGL